MRLAAALAVAVTLAGPGVVGRLGRARPRRRLDRARHAPGVVRPRDADAASRKDRLACEPRRQLGVLAERNAARGGKRRRHGVAPARRQADAGARNGAAAEGVRRRAARLAELEPAAVRRGERGHGRRPDTHARRAADAAPRRHAERGAVGGRLGRPARQGRQRVCTRRSRGGQLGGPRPVDRARSHLDRLPAAGQLLRGPRGGSCRRRRDARAASSSAATAWSQR